MPIIAKDMQREFPILSRVIGEGEEPLAYLDSAATALTPLSVQVAMRDYLLSSCSNIHRGAHLLAEESTEAYESAREKIALFLGCDDSSCTIFTHGATESLNMIASCWGGSNLRKGDLVALAIDNHHAGIVPWQMLRDEKGIEIAYIDVDEEGCYADSSIDSVLALKPKLVVAPLLGNVLGFVQPSLAHLLDDARACGSRIALDCSQAVGHIPFDVSRFPIDFAAFSAHKMYGFTGVGVLWCSNDAMREMKPVFGGGGMISSVTTEGYRCAEPPACFEAGTPAIASAIGFGSAIDFIEACGLEDLQMHSTRLCSLAVGMLDDLPGVAILGGIDHERVSLVSFSIKGVHPHDAARCLSDKGIMVRAGHHCAMPLHQALRIPASIRASFGAYSTEADVIRLEAAVRELTAQGRGA